MEDLLAEFVAETREMLEAMGGEIVAWEADPRSTSRLDSIFRFVHTVKGNCGFFDLPRLEKLSHATEGTLAEVRAGRRHADAQLVTAVLAVIDRITDMIDAIEAGHDLPEEGDEALIAALEPEGDTSEAQTIRVDEGTEARVFVSSNSARSIRLPVELLDRVMSGVSDLVLARNDLARRLREAGTEQGIEGHFERLSAILDDVRDGITRIRMQRIEYLFGTLPRLVRDLSAELGKQVMIDLEGGNVELDREMIEMIRDPLVHIIRNAIDHGIETPSERLAAGKREIGLLHISARQSGNKISLAISDDGGGINDEKLASKAVSAGLISKADAQRMTAAERYELMFSPGLSTADTVTSISGRGVGMDVVRANIERIGGQISVNSVSGEGTTIHLRLPLTLSIIPALTVGVGDQKFAVPRGFVEEITDAAADEPEFAEAGEQILVRIRGRLLPCIPLGRQLGVMPRRAIRRSLLMLVRLGNSEPIAIAVDEIHDHEDLVIKPLAPSVMATGIYSGTTLLDDGTPMLMLDVNGLAAQAGIGSEKLGFASRIIDEDTPAAREKPAVSVLQFTGLDGRRRAIRMDVVDRVEKVPSEAIDVKWSGAQAVIDGRIFAVAGAEHGQLPDDEISLLRLSDGVNELAYAIGDIVETSTIDGEITTSECNGELESVALVDGQMTELVDCHRLFAEYGRPREARERPICLLPSGDSWTETILRPLVEAAGYSVISSEDEAGEDGHIAIALAEADWPAPQQAEIIRLHTDPDRRQAAADGIYRYDRSSLLAALNAARTRRSA